MSKKKRQPTPERPGPIRWEFGPEIPTHDFFEEQDLDDIFDVDEAVANFIFDMEHRSFLAWEAVVCHEQGVPLTRQQRAALSELINFGDPDDEQILYIDEIPRTTEPWYEIFRKIVSRLLVQPFRTLDAYTEAQHDGWRNLVHCLNKHGDGLSLPQGATSPVQVIPADLRHRLDLQDCFSELSGLGQFVGSTLESEDEQYCVDDFINILRTRKEAVEFLDL
ncbi:MAG: hypothetical protein FJ276_32075, partial [Planctomycetes bacterium]|nr:hypothetical protein [Planctomycetota bacterium]